MAPSISRAVPVSWMFYTGSSNHPMMKARTLEPRSHHYYSVANVDAAPLSPYHCHCPSLTSLFSLISSCSVVPFLSLCYLMPT